MSQPSFVIGRFDWAKNRGGGGGRSDGRTRVTGRRLEQGFGQGGPTISKRTRQGRKAASP